MTPAPEPRHLSASEAHDLLEQSQAVLLDARDARLFDNAHIRGAHSVPLSILTATPGKVPVGALPEHPGLRIFYCA